MKPIYKTIIIIILILVFVISLMRFIQMRNYVIFLTEQIEKKEKETKELTDNIINKCSSKESEKDNCLFKELIELSNPAEPFLLLSPYKGVWEAISNEKIKAMCKEHYLSIALGTAQDCSFINNITLKDSCIFKSSMNGKDLRFCSAISDPRIASTCQQEILSNKERLIADCQTKKPSCLQLVAIHLLDVSICEEYDKTIDKELCIRAYAKELEDPSICELISIKDQRNYCISEIAEISNDIELCEQLDDPRACTYNIAIKTSNKELCYKTSNIDSCLHAIAAKTAKN